MQVVSLSHGRLSWWCPGCNCPHEVGVEPPNGWAWNESFGSPTLTPSVLVTSDERCHSFMSNGALQFLSDSTHELSNQTVPMGTFVFKE